MAEEKPKIEIIPDDEALYISPTSDDSLAERYAKVRTRESKMSNEERIKRIREAPSIFDFEPETDKEG